jgi:hypothetical protein
MYCLLYTILLNLVFVQYSVLATWSPHRHPLQHHNNNNLGIVDLRQQYQSDDLVGDIVEDDEDVDADKYDEIKSQTTEPRSSSSSSSLSRPSSLTWWGVLTSYWYDGDINDVDPVRRSIERFRRLHQYRDRPPRGGSSSTSTFPEDNNTDQQQYLQQQHYHQYHQQHQQYYEQQQQKQQPHRDALNMAHPSDTQQDQQLQSQQQLPYDDSYHPNHQSAQYDHQQQLQQHYHRQHHYQQQPAAVVIVTREKEEPPFVPPNVQLEHVSLALRLTSEWNRRLTNGINRLKKWKKTGNNNQGHDEQQQEGHRPVNVHPSRVWHPPIRNSATNDEGDDDTDELTVFHAKQPALVASSPSSCLGVRHWGPDMESYLEGLVELFGLNNIKNSHKKQNQPSTDGNTGGAAAAANSDSGMIELPLAMIYLDRACSVDTPRTLFQGYYHQHQQQQSSNGIVGGISNGGGGGGRIGVVAPCPFCTPRTVHRLALAALLLAVECVHGTQRMEEACARVIEQVSSSSTTDSSSAAALLPADMTANQLLPMVQWMKAALGDAGLLVTIDEMKAWVDSWEAVFGPSSR